MNKVKENLLIGVGFKSYFYFGTFLSLCTLLKSDEWVIPFEVANWVLSPKCPDTVEENGEGIWDD